MLSSFPYTDITGQRKADAKRHTDSLDRAIARYALISVGPIRRLGAPMFP
jgi:hypothetical protein